MVSENNAIVSTEVSNNQIFKVQPTYSANDLNRIDTGQLGKIILKEYERIVVFRFSRFFKNCHMGPGPVKLLKGIDEIALQVDLRELFKTVEIVEYTKDRVPLEIILAIFYEISDPISTINLKGFPQSFLNQANVIIAGHIRGNNLGQILKEKRRIQEEAKEELIKFMVRYGVRINRFEFYSIAVQNPSVKQTSFFVNTTNVQYTSVVRNA
ncbi:unnamed protein product [Brachionus calyciflorus]|uniref:Band 7 domain-containing protein n=1 Tax=Brachionus calyciflorus TaxID=104777 RepID=A0A813VRZ7_9BILA|nr:unnamed protein product [Brachionus calyciflorus]